MHKTIALLAGLLWQALAIPLSGLNEFYPSSIAFGNATNDETHPFTTFTLDKNTPVATLDYGYEVAGYPFFQVSSFQGKVQVESRYTEDLGDIDLPFSDGPFSFGQGLTNTYRVETFDVTSACQLESYLAQGGQRWQTLRLLTSGSVTFSKVGFKATVDKLDYNRLPGQFTSSSPLYDEIWKLGARAAGASCFAAGAYKTIWETSDSGVFIRGSRAGLTTRANDFTKYNLTFSAKIQRGGLGWTMAYPVSTRYGGIQVNLVSNYRESTTYVNVNRTLLPPNSIALAYGFNLVNQTTLASYYLDNFKVPFQVKEGQWYSISAVMYDGNYVAVSVDGVKVFNVTLNNYYIGTPTNITTGSFGFGGWQDQAGYVKDVTVVSSNGTTIYTNPMTNSSTVLPEFGVQSNTADICMDGAKRDRLVWLGDFYHTAAIISTSTNRKDYSAGTLQTFLDWQLPSGQLPLNTPIGYPGSATLTFASFSEVDGYYYFLEDYHILGLLAFGSHMRYNNDINFAKKNWEQWKLAVQYLIGKIDNTTGIVTVGYAFFGDGAGLAVNAASVQAFKELAEVAIAVGDNDSAQAWSAVARNLTSTIQSKFWQPSLGHFSDNPQNATKLSVQGLSFVITSGIASASQATSCINALTALKLSPGYKDTTDISSDGVVNISPNTNGFLLPALLQSNRTAEAKYLFENLWAAMINNETTHSGASWEYVDTNLQPGLSRYTSLSHPWGGAPTYILTEYIAGIRPVTFGYKTWVIAPAYTGFDLKSTSAQVTTPYGVLRVQWSVANGKINAVVNAPAGTSGTFVINRALSNSTKANTVVQVQGGAQPKALCLDL
ncbi:Six-hairpin glycosidase, partial [Aureobasidium melanogenum]